MGESISLVPFLNRSSTSENLQAGEWGLIQPKQKEDLAVFSAKEVKSAAADERERIGISLHKDTGNRYAELHLNELSEIKGRRTLIEVGKWRKIDRK